MNKMKRYLILMTAAALVAGCSNDADEVGSGYVPSNNAIAFDASTDDVLTRAKGEIDDNTDLQNANFGVFGSYTGALKYENTTVSPDFMYNQEVKYSGGSWSYRPVKYWPNDSREYVSFFAYAPYEATPKDDGRCIIDMSKLYDLGDPWINYRIAEDPWGTDANGKPNQVDLLYGQQEKVDDTDPNNPVVYYTSWLDQQRPADPVNGKLKFTFRHALACIGDYITIKCSQQLATLLTGYATLTINQIKINYKNLTTKGRLVLRSEGSANWKEIISGELTTTRTYTENVNITFGKNGFVNNGSTNPNTTDQLISSGNGLFYIPLRVAGTEEPTAEVIINYTVTNNATDPNQDPNEPDPHAFTGTSSVSFPLDMNMEGTKQGIALQLTKTLDLQHLVYVIGNGATEPSYSRKR